MTHPTKIAGALSRAGIASLPPHAKTYLADRIAHRGFDEANHTIGGLADLRFGMARGRGIGDAAPSPTFRDLDAAARALVATSYRASPRDWGAESDSEIARLGTYPIHRVHDVVTNPGIGGVGTALGLLAAALVGVAAGSTAVAGGMVKKIIGKLQAAGIEPVPPRASPAPGWTLVAPTDGAVKAAFDDPAGVLNSLVASGWRWQRKAPVVAGAGTAIVGAGLLAGAAVAIAAATGHFTKKPDDSEEVIVTKKKHEFTPLADMPVAPGLGPDAIAGVEVGAIAPGVMIAAGILAGGAIAVAAGQIGKKDEPPPPAPAPPPAAPPHATVAPPASPPKAPAKKPAPTPVDEDGNASKASRSSGSSSSDVSDGDTIGTKVDRPRTKLADMEVAPGIAGTPIPFPEMESTIRGLTADWEAFDRLGVGSKVLPQFRPEAIAWRSLRDGWTSGSIDPESVADQAAAAIRSAGAIRVALKSAGVVDPGVVIAAPPSADPVGVASAWLTSRFPGASIADGFNWKSVAAGGGAVVLIVALARLIR